MIKISSIFKYKIAYLVQLLFLIFFTSCSDDAIQNENVFIRVKNVSQFEFTDVEINTSGGINNYGLIAVNDSSEYKSFDFAYRHAKIELKIDTETYLLQPIDYVGEKKIASGKYTYKINANPDGDIYNKLSLVFVKD